MADYTFIGQMAYNEGSQVVSALNSGNISVAVNNSVDYGDLNWCATCGACDGYVIMVDSYFMGKTNLESAQAICYCTGSLDHEVLLNRINRLALTKSDGPFTTLEDAMDWVETNGLFVTNQNYPPIITNGNVLHLDGGLPASYPMVGTSWYDLTGNENNGVLNNGVSYNSSFKGYLNFNGSNQYVSFSGVTDIPVGNSNYTIGVWFNTDANNDDGLVGWGNYGSDNEVNAFRLTPTGLTNYWWGNDLAVTTTITPGNWYYAVATFDGTTRSIYVNGVLAGSDTPTGHNVTISNNLTIGRTWTGEYFDGSIGDVQIFDRALSDVEINQNYEVMVTRYDGSNTEICLTPVYCNSPTPTPTSTPTITGCAEFELYGGESGRTFNFTNCDGQPQSATIPQGDSAPFCIQLPYFAAGAIQGESCGIAYSGVCNTYFFGIDTFPGESTTFGYYEYPSGTYTQITITAPDAIFANAYSNPGVFYVSGDSGYTIENYGPCSLTPTPTSSSTSTPTPTPTNTPTPTGGGSNTITREGGICSPNQIESNYIITGEIGDVIVLKSTFSGQIQKVGSTGSAAAATSIGNVSDLSTCYSDTSTHFFSIAPTYTFTMSSTSEIIPGSAVTWNSFETLTTLTVEIVSVNGVPNGQSITGCRGDSTGGPC
jgi:hypothetical protein